MPVFNAFVRPILEYASSVWSPVLVKYNRTIESVQRRFTKRLCGLSNVSYEHRIRVLGTCTLNARRNYTDLVELFKIVRGLSTCGISPYFACAVRKTRGHQYRLKLMNFKLNARKSSFFCRVIGNWNSLPRQIVEVRTLSQFKSNLRRHMCIWLFSWKEPSPFTDEKVLATYICNKAQ